MKLKEEDYPTRKTIKLLLETFFQRIQHVTMRMRPGVPRSGTSGSAKGRVRMVSEGEARTINPRI